MINQIQRLLLHLITKFDFILNHSLTAQGSALPILPKSVVSVMHEPNIIRSKTYLALYLYAFMCRPFGGILANGKKENNDSNDNYFILLCG